MKLTGKTTLQEIIDAGAERLSDIPLSDLLEYIRNQSLIVSRDLINEPNNAAEVHSNISVHIQNSLDELDKWVI